MFHKIPLSEILKYLIYDDIIALSYITIYPKILKDLISIKYEEKRMVIKKCIGAGCNMKKYLLKNIKKSKYDIILKCYSFNQRIDLLENIMNDVKKFILMNYSNNLEGLLKYYKVFNREYIKCMLKGYLSIKMKNLSDLILIDEKFNKLEKYLLETYGIKRPIKIKSYTYKKLLPYIYYCLNLLRYV